MQLVGCPWQQVTQDVESALYAARQAKQGMWPVVGGWLDQTQKCLDAVQFANATIERFSKRPEE